MKILKHVQRIPGGLMLVPMFLAMVLYTFLPQAALLGNPAHAVFSSDGTMTVVGILLVFAGIQTDPRSLVLCAKKSGLLILIKLIISVALGLAAMYFFGRDGVFGISTLALTACIASSNAGLYIAMMENHGDDGDKAGYALLNIVGLPFVPVCILGYAAGSGIDWGALLATLVPYGVGIALGQVDGAIREFTRHGTSVTLPFLGFCLGSGIDLRLAATSLGTGIVLYVIYLVFTCLPLLAVEKGVLRHSGYVSIAISTVAGLSMTVPGLMVEVDGAYGAYAQQAVAQLAVVVVLSSVTAPYLFEKFLPAPPSAGGVTGKSNGLQT